MSDRIQTIKYTVHDWVPVLVNFGIGEEYLTGKNTPCPICSGKDRFIFSNKFGNGNSHCRQCDPNHQDGIGLIQKYNGWNLPEALTEIEKYLGIHTKKQSEYQNSKYKRDRHNKRYLKAQQIHCLAIGSKSQLTEEEKARHSEANRFIHDFKKIYPNHLQELGI